MLTITGKGALEKIFSGDRYPTASGGHKDAKTNYTSIIVGDGITSLCDSAFGWNDYVKTITLGKDVTFIDEYAFYSDEALTSISLPAGLTSIGPYAFHYCDSLTDVYFAGTRAQWMAISVGSSNEELSNATVHCSDGDLIYDLDFSVDSDGVLTFTGTGHLDTSFSSYTDITKVVLGKGVLSMPSNCFYKCSKLQSIEVEDGNAHFCSIDGVLFTKDKKTLVAYPRGKAGKYTLPNTTETIDSDAFSRSVGLTEAVMNEGLKTVQKDAFERCSNLKTVSISSTVSKISSSYVFDRCTSLTSFSVAEGNTTYFAKDGVLFENYLNDNVRMLYFPCGKSGKYTLPDNIHIAEEFSHCPNLTEVVLGKDISYLYTYTFDDCPKLKSVTIPSSVTDINSPLFDDCPALETINFGGTKAAWLNLVDYKNANNASIIFATIKCSDGDIVPSTTLQFYIDDLQKVSATFNKSTGKLTISGAGEWDADYIDGFKEHIKEVVLESGVDEIAYDGFYDCENLTKITIPVSVTKIYDYALCACYKLDDIYYAGTRAQWQALLNNSMENCDYSPNSEAVVWATIHCSDGDYYCDYLEDCEIEFSSFDMVLPKGITTIEKEAFKGMDSSLCYYIPDGCKSIGSKAFADCEGTIFVPSSVTSIAEDAFNEYTTILVDSKISGNYPKIFALKNGLTVYRIKLVEED